MMVRTILCIVFALLCVVNGLAQSRRQRSNSASRNITVADIRQVDFLNFTYHSNLCSQELKAEGIVKIVRVRKGEFKNDMAYFGVVNDKAIYGDLTGDGSEEAIIQVACGAIGSTFGFSEVFIYMLQNGRTILLAEINDKGMERDYLRYYPSGGTFTMWWGIRDVKLRNGNIEIEALVDGSHAAPQYVVTLEYRVNGKNLNLTGKPRRRNFG